MPAGAGRPRLGLNWTNVGLKCDLAACTGPADPGLNWTNVGLKCRVATVRPADRGAFELD